MDYKKAYKEALIAVKRLQDANPNDKGIQNWIEDSFPELKESEEEKNIKNLIDELKCSLRAANCQNEACNGGHEKRIALLEWAIAWLEKQGTVIKDTISMDVNSETEWDDIHKFLRMNLDGEKVKLLIIREE